MANRKDTFFSSYSTRLTWAFVTDSYGESRPTTNSVYSSGVERTTTSRSASRNTFRSAAGESNLDRGIVARRCSDVTVDM